jgi:hypothetical protein
MPYGGFSPIRLQGRRVSRGLPEVRQIDQHPTAVCLRPSCRLRQHTFLAQSRGIAPVQQHRRASGFAALPQGPSLRSGLCCPSPSSLNRPHPPRSPTRRNFPAAQVICDVFAVLAHHQPKQSTSGSELSHTIPSQPVTLVCPRRVRRLHTPRLRRWGSPSSGSTRTRHSHTFHLNPLRVGTYFGASWFTHSLRPAELLASLADRTNVPIGLQRLLLPSFRSSRSPFSPSDITTGASGYLPRQDFHLLERLLASLHWSLRFISLRAFCMRWMRVAASSTKVSRWRMKERSGTIAALGRKLARKSPTL